MQWQEPRRRRAHMYCYLKHTCSSFQTIIYLILKKNLISKEVDISGKLFFRLPISDKTDGREIALSLCYCLRVSASRTRPLVRVRLSSTDAVHPFGICLHLFCLFFSKLFIITFSCLYKASMRGLLLLWLAIVFIPFVCFSFSPFLITSEITQPPGIPTTRHVSFDSGALTYSRSGGCT